MTDAITPKVRSVENMVKRSIEKTKNKRGTPSCPTCHVTLWISLFFDGTGNHKERDFPFNHSNIAALVDAHEDQRNKAIYRFYYEGLGRPFEFKDRYETKTIATRAGLRATEKIGYKEDSDSLMGKGFAVGIQERIEKALFDFTIVVEDWKKSRRLDEINLAVFGFSRGATEARAFLHWLKRHSKVKDEGKRLSYDGVPLRVKFLGIFDTVESVGALDAGVIKTKVPRFVEKCTHIVAAHELRDAFSLTGGDGNTRHVVYPGAHSDVGGGYKPGEQGRSNHLSRIALLQMLDEARGAGLKMKSLGEMKSLSQWERLFKPSFDVPAEATTALNNYMAEIKPSGTIQQHFDAHMAQYWAWIDAGLAAEDIKQKRTARSAGAPVKELHTMSHLLRHQARTAAGRGQYGNGPARNAVKPAVEKMFEHYVHDSFEHFSMTGGTVITDMSIADYYKVRKILPPTEG